MNGRFLFLVQCVFLGGGLCRKTVPHPCKVQGIELNAGLSLETIANQRSILILGLVWFSW